MNGYLKEMIKLVEGKRRVFATFHIIIYTIPTIADNTTYISFRNIYNKNNQFNFNEIFHDLISNQSLFNGIK